MNDDEIIAFTERLLPLLPNGYGFLCQELPMSTDTVALVIEATDPPFPPGQVIWIAKRLVGGSTLKGALLISPDQDPDELLVRALCVVGVLEAQEKRHAARWN